MSMPEFPEVNPDLTCEQALNMILTSIAMEEQALSHIIEAEGEKLKYVLRSLEEVYGKHPPICEIIAVNQSVESLLDSIAQNQMLLKSKMEKALSALAKMHPCPPCPPSPPCPPDPPGPPCKCPCKCSAVFRAAEKCRLPRGEYALGWSPEHISGGCVCFDPCFKTKINLRPSGRFMVGFAVNVKSTASCGADVSACLQLVNCRRRADIFTIHEHAAENRITTISMSGLIVETDPRELSSLLLKLTSTDTLILEDAVLNIIEI